MVNEEAIKEAFTKIKEEMHQLKQEINILREKLDMLENNPEEPLDDRELIQIR